MEHETQMLRNNRTAAPGPAPADAARRGDAWLFD